jgi:hypothetical protein
VGILPTRNVRRTLFRVGLRRPPRGAGPPDFIGVGALGAGCAWWHGLLLKHPQVDPLRFRIKQLHFFDEFCTRPMTDADVETYRRSFRRRKPGTVSGEWTPRYMYDVWAPPLIARAAPGAKLLVMVSDPIERYRVKLARELLDGEPDDIYLRMDDVSSRGRYGSQLRALRAWFGEDRILVLQYEKCQVDPLGEYARTLRFLGLSEDFQPERLQLMAAGGSGPKWYVRILHRLGMPEDFRRRLLLRSRLLRRITRRTPDPDPAELWPELEESLHAELDPEVAALQAIVPELDVSLWPNFARLDARAEAAAAGTARPA